MPRIKTLLFIITALSFMGCSQVNNEDDIGGTDVTSQFLEDYSGQYVDAQTGETININRNGEVEILKHRQVGEDNNPAIPRPTHCSFYLSGQISYVAQLPDDKRLRVNEEGTQYFIPRTHNMVFSVHNVALSDELEESSTTDDGCQNFQQRMNERFPVFTYGMELYGSGHIRFHTVGEEGFSGGDRTEGTLDEVFTRE
jgi:hypothetical protein